MAVSAIIRQLLRFGFMLSSTAHTAFTPPPMRASGDTIATFSRWSPGSKRIFGRQAGDIKVAHVTPGKLVLPRGRSTGRGDG